MEWDLTTERVLTMEYCDGVHIDDCWMQKDPARVDGKLVAEAAFGAMLTEPK